MEKGAHLMHFSCVLQWDKEQANRDVIRIVDQEQAEQIEHYLQLRSSKSVDGLQEEEKPFTAG